MAAVARPVVAKFSLDRVLRAPGKLPLKTLAYLPAAKLHRAVGTSHLATERPLALLDERSNDKRRVCHDSGNQKSRGGFPTIPAARTACRAR